MKTTEKDPLGKDPHELGAKLDDGKLLGGLIGDFGLALEEVCRVSTFGANKYTRGGWAHVPNGPQRYYDAFWRHTFRASTEMIDPDSGMLHKAQMIWNLLASLELELRIQMKDEKAGVFGFLRSHTSGGQSDQPSPGGKPVKEQAAAGNPEVCARHSWPQWHMETARFYAGRSKDPSTHVGAVAVGDHNEVREVGYNGLPRGVRDLPERMERPEKYRWTCHAEENLVATAARWRLAGTTVYVTHLCCNRCAGQLINAGVSRVVVGNGKTSMPVKDFEVAIAMLQEAGVDLVREDGRPVTADIDGEVASSGGGS